MTTTLSNDDGPQLAPELHVLTHILDANSTAFAVRDQVFRNAALEATKFVFDTSLNTELSSIPHISQLLASLTPSEAPTTRASKKRKRAPSPLSARVTFKQTPLQELIVNELDENQLWAQLDLKAQGVCDMLDVLLEGEEDLEAERPLGMMPFLPLEDDPDDELDDDALDSELPSLDSDEVSGEDQNENENDESIMELQGPSSDEDDEDIVVQPKRRWERHKQRESGLDDDFFSLSTFNAETELAEANFVSGGELAGDDEDEDDPIDFSVNPEDSSNAYFYKDFFGAPSKKQKAPGAQSNSKVRFQEEVRVKKIDRRGRGLSVRALTRGDEPGMDDDDFDEEFEEDDLEGLLPESQELNGSEESDSEGPPLEYDDREIVARMNHDLFEEDEDEVEQLDTSTHEKRIAALQKQIAELETENVRPKDWVLMGEANSRSRPQNSLLEEDLEFDRTVRVAPVTTTESVQQLEDRIKARILEGRFDDVVRVRPMDDKPFLPSRLLEAQDTKSKQSLAQIYEEEYVAAQDGITPGASRDAKLQQEHKEIEAVWEKICSKLDALCNAHFTPKQPKATITSIGNASSASMESALPTTMSAKTMLAPEEVFTSSSTDLRAKSEMTPREKKVLHNKQRKAKSKARHQLEKNVDKFAKSKKVSTKKQKDAALASVVKSGRGVTVVGKRSVSKKNKITRS
ncbi:Mpp10 protein [Pluteus cervinus]|uniref:Mpp10 protein n=1 Tax=Pluteus cervinus TaxID=181527 RepID=A0ACD3BG21_9AGAR|nr:Mpp10 protein [Pluteus cervinus]